MQLLNAHYALMMARIRQVTAWPYVALPFTARTFVNFISVCSFRLISMF